MHGVRLQNYLDESVKYSAFSSLIYHLVFKNQNKPYLNTWTVYASMGSANNNKLSLVGMQLPEKYKENFDVSIESLRLE